MAQKEAIEECIKIVEKKKLECEEARNITFTLPVNKVCKSYSDQVLVLANTLTELFFLQGVDSSVKEEENEK
jgi:hypothetical protein